MRVGLAQAAPGTYGRGHYVLAVLFLVGVFHLMDRSILGILLEPIRREFGMPDAAMGLLTGYAFALFYTMVSLPIARLADRYSRRVIIALGLTFWSLLTSISGLATSFWQLALARVGVGVGEAAYIPTASSILSDYFPAARRAGAFSIFAASSQIGIMASLLVGGRLGAAVGWRLTLVWIGLPGLVLALLVWLTVAEPPRGAAETEGADVTLYALGETFAYLWRQRAFRHLAGGATLSLFALSSLLVWSPAFLMRVHGMGLAQAGLWLGLPTGIAGATGVVAGGLFTQRLARRDRRWLFWMPALTSSLALPFVLLFLFLPGRALAVPMFFAVLLFLPAMLGPAMATAQGLAKVRMRALAGALVSIITNLCGVALGPLLVGVLSDILKPGFGTTSLRYALPVTGVATLWGGLHFLLGARYLRADLTRSSAAPAL